MRVYLTYIAQFMNLRMLEMKGGVTPQPSC